MHDTSHDCYSGRFCSIRSHNILHFSGRLQVLGKWHTCTSIIHPVCVNQSDEQCENVLGKDLGEVQHHLTKNSTATK